MKSVMTHQFTQVPKAEIPRSVFDRSHGRKMTTAAASDTGGQVLYPVYVDEALPGDSFNMNVTTFARLATPLHPLMDNIFCDIHFFAVPYRLVWTHFVNFFGEQANPTDSTSFLVPQCAAPVGGVQYGALHDSMGLPTNIYPMLFNNLHCRAYNLIWNQWYRDQNLQNSVVVDMGDGPDTYANYAYLKRNKRHDYFTSSLPWPQKGPAVTIPIGTSAPVRTSGTAQVSGSGLTAMTYLTTTGIAPTVNQALAVGGGANAITSTNLLNTATGFSVLPSNLYADLSTATAATINQLRQAFQIQKIYERDARGGTRYTELILSHFGVSSPDARLQRAEYLGGGTASVNINPIAQTSATGVSGGTTPQGNLAGIGTMSHKGVGFTKSFTEHCLLLGLMSFRADLTYQQGLNRMWSRQTRFDFYWPALAMIGEQAVLNQEIMCQGTAADTQTFGYQERFAEYRYKPSEITGQFRSNYATPLDSWHLSQSFASLPTLASAFITENPPFGRVVAVPASPTMIVDMYFSLRCARPMPLYGVPGLIDHF